MMQRWRAIDRGRKRSAAHIVMIAAALVTSTCVPRAAVPPGFQGIVELDQAVIAFEVSGRVQDVPVHRGDVVKDGDVLARLDDTLTKLTNDARIDDANSARADLALLVSGSRREDIAALANDVRAARASEDLATKNAERTHALTASGSLPQADLDRAQSDLDRAHFQRQSLGQRLASLERGARPEEITRAKARVAASLSAVSLEEELLARHVLRATREGEVLDVTVKVGELATVGTPALTLADALHPYVDVFVPQGNLDGVRVGGRAEVRVDATTQRFSATVEWISPKTEFTPRFLFSEQERPYLVVRVRVRVDDPGRRLHAGVPAFVRMLS
jgi:HlyD family secretion protein